MEITFDSSVRFDREGGGVFEPEYVRIRRAVPFAAEAGAGDVEIFGFEFGGLHAAAVVLHDDGSIGEDVRDGDVDFRGLRVPCVIHEFLQSFFAGGEVLTQNMREPGIDAEVDGFLHGR